MGLSGLILAALLVPVAGAASAHPRAAAISALHVWAHDTTLGSRAEVRARLQDTTCGVYGACRAAPAEGTVVWRVTSRRDPEVHFQHRSVVDDGRASWRTPRLWLGGGWTVQARYSGTADLPAAVMRTSLRVTRR